MSKVIGVMKCKGSSVPSFMVKTMCLVDDNEGMVGVKDDGDEYHVYCQYWSFEPVSKWKYLKGSEKDFAGAPEWATQRIKGDNFPECSWIGELGGVKLVTTADSADGWWQFNDGYHRTVIAQREPITNVTVNISAPCGEDDLNECIGQHHCREKVGELHIDGKSHEAQLGNKYLREIKPGVWIDVYDVLAAWGVLNPALQHLIKKALQTGERGHKTREQDLQDIIDSAIRAKELEQK